MFFIEISWFLHNYGIYVKNRRFYFIKQNYPILTKSADFTRFEKSQKFTSATLRPPKIIINRLNFAPTHVYTNRRFLEVIEFYRSGIEILRRGLSRTMVPADLTMLTKARIHITWQKKQINYYYLLLLNFQIHESAPTLPGHIASSDSRNRS